MTERNREAYNEMLRQGYPFSYDLAYLCGRLPEPNYPVPSCIVHVDCGLASGLEQRDQKTGEILFKVWDTPMPDGEMFIFPGQTFAHLPATYFDDCPDVTDWY
jgi:hypothetical protein